MEARRESDEWLMSQVAHGKREHLATLIGRYGSPLLTFIQRMAGDRHRAEELFQEVFLAVWLEAGRYVFPRPFKPWLFGIAVNKCKAAARRLRWDGDGSGELVAYQPGHGPSPVEAAIAAETAALVEQAVTLLPANQRAVLVMRLWNGMSYFEIAEIMGRSEGTVRSHMFHALAAVRRRLEPRLR